MMNKGKKANAVGLLLGLQARQWFGVNKALHTKEPGEKAKLLAFGGLMVLVGALCVFTSVMYSVGLAALFGPLGALRLLPGAMMTASCLLSFFTTLYKAGSLLFGGEDTEMLLALPVSTRSVAASRLLVLYGLNLAFCLLLILPAGIVYAVYTAPGPFYYGALALGLLLTPLLPVAAAAVIGCAVTVLTAGFRHKNLVYTAALMLVLVGVVVLSMMGGTVDMSGFIQAATEAVANAYPPAVLFMGALCDGSLKDLLLFAAISIGVFVLFVWAAGHWLRQIHSLLAAGRTGSGYRLKEKKPGSQAGALCRRELRRYFASPVYVLNTGMGLVLMLLTAAASLFVGTDWLDGVLGIPGAAAVIADILPFVLALFLSLGCITACSISLEGRQLWLVRSLPVTAGAVLTAKLRASCLLQGPVTLVSALLFVISLRPAPGRAVLFFLLPMAYMLLFASLGLLINLAFPNFTWTNETVPVKQSPAMLLALLAGMACAGIPMALLLIFLQGESRMWGSYGVLALLAAADGVLLRLLRTRGAKRFAQLS